MIEIITEEVAMPELNDRRFQKNPKDVNGKKWEVEDTHEKRIIYTGKYEDAAIRCHNLNKKYYRELPNKKED